jgi:DNA mismatch endonuclease, patch repair protein
MQRQRRRDTAPELLLRRAVWGRGLRYRVDVAPIRGARRRADLVFTRAKVAVYVDGCFWHRCPRHATTPKANREWWVEKLDANVARDRDSERRLHEAGWIALRTWEHEDPDIAAARVERVVRERTAEFARANPQQGIRTRSRAAR